MLVNYPVNNFLLISVSGAKVFKNHNPCPPATWINVFDKKRRYKKAFCAYSMPQIIADSLTIICAATFSSFNKLASAVSYWIAKRLVTIPYVSLPNIIAGEYLVPELIQCCCARSHQNQI
jgi:hypothetical protein